MPTVSMRVSAEEKSWMDGYAKVRGINLSEAIKSAFFDKLEEEYDLQIVREYEAEKAKGNMKYYTLAEVKAELGLD